MLKNTLINREVIKVIANALGTINERVIYVGGAVVSLYIDDATADDVRPTKDVDITLEIANLGELERLREELIARGFYQSSEDNVICRFRYTDIQLDVMATREIGWAPANVWFERGFPLVHEKKVDNQVIKILPLPYYFATKFSAFHDRGYKDPRTSQDFEDIVYLLNHTSDIKEQLTDIAPDLKQYLKIEFQNILDNPILQEAIIANLFYEDQMSRFNKIMELLKDCVNSL